MITLSKLDFIFVHIYSNKKKSWNSLNLCDDNDHNQEQTMFTDHVLDKLKHGQCVPS